MKHTRIAPGSFIEELAWLALSVHNAACGIPVAVKLRDSSGVLIEGGEFIIAAPECDSLDCLFSGDHVREVRISNGRHRGKIMFASTVVDAAGRRVAAIGIVDTLGMLSLERFVSDRDRVEWQIGGCSPRR